MCLCYLKNNISTQIYVCDTVSEPKVYSWIVFWMFKFHQFFWGGSLDFLAAWGFQNEVLLVNLKAFTEQFGLISFFAVLHKPIKVAFPSGIILETEE